VKEVGDYKYFFHFFHPSFTPLRVKEVGSKKPMILLIDIVFFILLSPFSSYLTRATFLSLFPRFGGRFRPRARLWDFGERSPQNQKIYPPAEWDCYAKNRPTVIPIETAIANRWRYEKPFNRIEK
jgi:hypothetical protein